MATFAEGFAQGKQEKKERDDREELKKLQIKKFKADLELKDKQLEELTRQRKARIQFFSQLQPSSAPSMGAEGPPPQPGKAKSFADIITDAQLQSSGLEAGFVSPKDIFELKQQQMVSGLFGQAGKDNNDMVVSGVKLDAAGRPMLDFAKRKLAREVPSEDGKSMIQLDQFGDEIGRRPVGPNERSKAILKEEGLDVDRANKVKGAFATIDRLEVLYSNIVNAASVSDKAAAVKLFNDFAEGTMAPLVKAAGESGNLAKEDIERALKLIPGGMTALTEISRKKLGLPKFQNLRAWFKDLEGKGGAGPAGDGWTPEKQKRLEELRRKKAQGKI